MLAITAEIMVIVFAGLTTGGLMVNWIGLARAMAKLSPSSYTEFHQFTNQTFDPYMPILVVGSIAGGLCQALVFGLQTPSGRLSFVGAGCFMIVLVLALTTNLPINKRIATWSIDQPPSNWTAERARWIRFHILRTLFSILALISYVASIVSAHR